MKRHVLSQSILAVLATTAVGLAAPQALFAEDSDDRTVIEHEDGKGRYLSGDFHNHTTCSDGSTSVQTLTRKSLTYLDWFVQSGHSGSYQRDCRLDDFAYDGSIDLEGDYWQNTEPGNIKGVNHDFTSGWGCASQPAGPENPEGYCKEMWRWQSLQEFNLPPVVDESIAANKPAFLGVEWVVPGHEHASNSIVAGQYDGIPNADALAHYEYCFARPSNDDSQGGGQGWTCEISEENNDKLIARFGGDPDQGPADYNATLHPITGINIDDDGDHVKSTASIYWMQENYPRQSYAVAAHVERQGAFIPEDDEGYNVEHLRDWNNASPDISFGFESQPGHQGQYHRGSYNAGRPTAGLWTWGGTGCYAAAEASKPGLDFEGNPLTQDDFVEGGAYPEINDDEDPAKVVLCRAGVRTMWDAMLSEGRRFWFLASSDWHSRGSFAPFDEERRTTNDFWPGEYQKNYTFVRDSFRSHTAQDIVDGLRSGNGYAVQGDLIDKLWFVACANNHCARMGETLEVEAGANVRVRVALRDPEGTNHSPYSFNNPSLLQVSIEQPINEPELVRVDLIKGDVAGLIEHTDPEYRDPLAPATTMLAKSWDEGDWRTFGRWKGMRYVLRDVQNDMYVRIRGTNIPAGTDNEQDENGNPLSDNYSDNILCTDPACPEHIFEGNIGDGGTDLNGDGDTEDYILTADVEAWADIWFYANPIFIEVQAGDDG